MVRYHMLTPNNHKLNVLSTSLNITFLSSPLCYKALVLLYSMCFCVSLVDMAVERNALMKEVVPYLTDICKHQGLEFEVGLPVYL